MLECPIRAAILTFMAPPALLKVSCACEALPVAPSTSWSGFKSLTEPSARWN